ncbi:MAG: T9SS type A sorting domain-containing protein [Bacteroidales bacterium]|nr:T9SS type A sorting domain-containing protein [Bacteroidales bacterium]
MRKFLIISFAIASFVSFGQNQIQPSGNWPYFYGSTGDATFNSFYIDNWESSSAFATGYVTESDGKDIYVSAFSLDAGGPEAKGDFFLWENTLTLPGNQVGKCVSDYIVQSKGYLKLIVGTSDDDAIAVTIENSGSMFGTPYIYTGMFGKSEFNYSLFNSSEFNLVTGYTTGETTNKDLLICFLADYGSGPFEYMPNLVYEGSGDDVGYSIDRIDMAYVIAGSTTSLGEGGKDGFIYLLDDQSCVHVWDTTFGTTADEEFFSIVNNFSTGEFISVGYTNSTGNKDFYIVGYNYYNNTHWIKTAGGLGDEEAYSIEHVTGGSGDGYYLITGYSTSFSADTAIYTIKMDYMGNLLWEGYYDEAGTQIAYDAATVNCEVWFAGSTFDVANSKNNGIVFGIPVVDVLIDVNNVSCFGYNDASAIVSYIGASYGITYNWLDFESIEFGYQEDTIENLVPGWYYLQGFDMYASPMGCSILDSILITEPDELVSYVSSQDVSCAGISDGWGAIIASGGTAPFSYSWSNGATTDTAFNLTEEVLYFVEVTDNNGCVSSQEFTIGKLGLAGIYGMINPTSTGDIADGLLIAELHKINGLGNAEIVTTADVYSMSFGFSDIEPGNYLVKIAVDPSLQPQLLNTYYESVYNWEEAIILEADCDVFFDDVVVTILESEVEFTGEGRFAGTVRMISTGAKDIGEPVPGAEIYLEQEPEGEPIAVTESDENGEWAMEGLPVNVGYSLSVDIPGFPLIQTYTNILVSESDTVFEELDFFVDTTDGNEGIYTEDPLNLPYTELENFSVKTYPNPFTNSFNIEFVINEPSEVLIQIYDIHGRLVFTKPESSLEAGSYNFQLDGEPISESGNYYISMKVNENIYFKKIVKL